MKDEDRIPRNNDRSASHTGFLHRTGIARGDPHSVLDGIGVRRGWHVADLGCGGGYFTIPFLDYVGEEGVIYAVDRDPDALSSLERSLDSVPSRRHQIRLLEEDISKTSIPSHSVDVVFFANVLHDIEDKRIFLEEVKRIAKESAFIVDIDWHREPSPFGPPFNIRITERDAKILAEENGFLVSKSIEAGPYHYGLLLMRANSGALK